MVSSISSIFGASFGSSSGDKLTDATKKKLEELGIDTSNIKTESQGQSVLAAIKKTKEAEGAKKPEAIGGNAEEESNKTKAKELAAQLNISVAAKDSTIDILNKISVAIDNLKTQAVGDPQKIQEAAKYQAAYDSIVGSVTSMQQQQNASHKKLAGSLDGMALYNKIKLGLT